MAGAVAVFGLVCQVGARDRLVGAAHFAGVESTTQMSSLHAEVVVARAG
ncbi:hypothetical protein [Nonomuraea fuscirosea]|nr:hypothetical protein [Nonomuraea fuscirosea]